jgi:RecA-family ATPase
MPLAVPSMFEDDPQTQFEIHLEALFSPGEFFGVVTAEADGSIRSKGRTYRMPEVDSEQTEKIPTNSLGTWVRVNPLVDGGSADNDVTAFRHVLIESDSASIEVQWAALNASDLPISAVVHSGGKSLHAFVRVDAKNLEEYKSRGKAAADAIERFEGMEVDRACLNPSRLSRLAGRMRGSKMQQLVAVFLGAPSWAQWEEEERARKFGKRLHHRDLLDFDAKADPESVLGNRWLCRGGSLLLLGQSGVGKSCLNLQLAGAWALGDPQICALLSFNIQPARPLKIVLIQAENDLGDMAEIWQGVFKKMGAQLSEEKRKRLEENLIILRNTEASGDAFLRMYRELCNDYKPDIAIVDPLLSYIGADINDQEICSAFTHRLNQVQQETGVISALVHHFGKPKSASQSNVLTETDLAYQGLGSSILTNWAREVLSLNRIKERPKDPPTFRLTATKRRKKAGMLSLEDGDRGLPSPSIFIQHSPDPVRLGTLWFQVPEPILEEDEETPKRGRR